MSGDGVSASDGATASGASKDPPSGVKATILGGDPWTLPRAEFEKWSERKLKPLEARTTYTLIPQNKGKIISALAEIAGTAGLSVARVPTSGDAPPPDDPIEIAGAPRVATGLSGFRDVLNPHEKKVDRKDLTKYSFWIHGAVDAIRVVPARDYGDQLVSMAVDPDAEGNGGLVALHKLKLRRQCGFLHDVIKIVVDPEDWTLISVESCEYTFAREEDPEGPVERCGLLTMCLLLDLIQPVVKVNTARLNEQLKNLSLESCEWKVSTYLKEAKDLKKQIEAERSNKYDDDEYMTLVFAQLKTHNQQDFQSDVRAARRDWENGKATVAQVEATILESFNRLWDLKEWANVEPSQSQIVALATGIAKNMLAKSLEQNKYKGGRGGKKGGKGGKKPDPPKKATGQPTMTKRSLAPNWQIKWAGHHIRHPDTNILMVWCPHHKSKDGVVDGMYMPAPHNHDEWLELRKQKRKDWKAKLAAKKRDAEAESEKPAAKRGKPIPNVDKLALSKSFKAAFCTQLQVSEEDVDAVIETALNDSLKG